MRKDAATISLVACAHALSHFYQLALAPLLPQVSADLGLSYTALGVVPMLLYAVSGLLQPFAGFVVDRVGGRGVLIGGVALMTLGAFVMSFAHGLGLLAFGAILMGLGNSVFHPADFSILNARVSQPSLGYAFSLHGVAGSLGFAAAPLFSATIGSAYGWPFALFAAGALGLVMVLVLLANAHQLHVAPAPRARQGFRADARVLLSRPVLMCFVFFLLWGASYSGLSNFGVAAMQLQYGIGATLASSALTAYMIGSAAGMLGGGYVAAQSSRHDVVAGTGLLAAALLVVLVGAGATPAGALPFVLGLAGFCAGLTNPSRDLIVRSSAPAGATGRVYGFVYSGLDVGSFVTPMFYGLLIDHGLPQGVFYVVFGFTLLALLTVLQLPGRRLAAQRASSHSA